MQNVDFKAVAEFIDDCNMILADWKAHIRVQTVIELHSVERDTSSDGYERYYPGTVTQVIEPKLQLRVTVFQEEFQQPEIPNIPTQTINPDWAALNFYFAGLKQCLFEKEIKSI